MADPDGRVTRVRHHTPICSPCVSLDDSYHWLRKAVERLRQRPVDNATNLLIAYVAGAINSVFTCPLWTVATQLKLQQKPRTSAGDPTSASSSSCASPAGSDARPGMAAALKSLYAKGGVSALFRGLPPALVLCVNPAIQFACYEMLKRNALKAMAALPRAAAHPALVRSQSPYCVVCSIGCSVVTTTVVLVTDH